MIPTPKISIVTVCRNVCRELQETYHQSAEQTYQNKEIIIVDGASTDGTREWLSTLQPTDARWASEPDAGIYDAMNKGVAMATGDYVIFMNAGDYFASVSVLEQVFGSGSVDADVVYGAVIKHDHVGVSHVFQAQEPHNAHRMFFCHQCAFTKRSLLLSHPFDTRHRMSADFKLYKQLIGEHRYFKRLELPIAVFDTSGVSNRHRADGLMDNISVIREVDGFWSRIKLLPRLYFQVLMCKLR